MDAGARLRDELVIHVEEHIRRHLGEHLTVEELAEVVGYSRCHFSRLFKSATGKTVCSFLSRVRVEAAAELIRDDEADLSLAQIASTCGFSDQPHFTRTFHTQIGITPAAYREQF